MSSDTIVALATPPGPSALALIRLSGPEAVSIIGKHFSKTLRPRIAHYGWFLEGERRIDDVVVSFFQGKASYSGEDLVEISSHGNMLIVDLILNALCRQGARLAAPGEFTQRAFLNGKMDLAQAEAVMDLIHARSERSLEAARRLKDGVLSRKVLAMQEELLNLLANLEAYIDFPDEDISPDVGANFLARIESLTGQADLLLATTQQGKMLREGLTLALVGKPNAGKSSLLNALLEEPRAIVSPVPGTTRDTIDAPMILEGIPLKLVDTAGIHESRDEIERLGMERTRAAARNADLILFVQDGTLPAEPWPGLHLEGAAPVLACRTKSDLPSFQSGAGIALSTINGSGLPELRHEIIRLLRLDESAASQDFVAINARHEIALQQAKLSLARAAALIRSSEPPEFISSDLRGALHNFGEIVGASTNEDILDRLFRTFCIGK